LGVVGQLPRELLFSLGAAQVMAPAAVFGAASGVLELGQSDAGLTHGHLPWWRARRYPELRKTYVRFYCGAPILLLAPGVALAIARADRVGHKSILCVILGALT